MCFGAERLGGGGPLASGARVAVGRSETIIKVATGATTTTTVILDVAPSFRGNGARHRPTHLPDELPAGWPMAHQILARDAQAGFGEDGIFGAHDESYKEDQMRAVEARALARQLQGDEERSAFMQARNAAASAAVGKTSPPRARAKPAGKDPRVKPSLPSFLQKKRPASEVERPEGAAGAVSPKQAKQAESAPAAASEPSAAFAAAMPALVEYDSSSSESDNPD